jgi:hypothetical protein
MKTLKLIAIAITAAAFGAPAFAGGNTAQLAAQKRAFEKAYASQEKANNPKALAGSTGPKGQVGPTTTSVPAFVNIGHPSERVRR